MIGMHRSGTTMLTNLLVSNGFFMGNVREVNEEAIFFLRLNSWMLRQCNASWDQPQSFADTNDQFKKKMIDTCRFHMNSRINFSSYVGFGNFFKYPRVDKLNFPWGWKDPRSTITLPVWRSIFPKAKVLHIYRNPVDVAASLKNRAFKEECNYRPNYVDIFKARKLIGKIHFTSSFSVMELQRGFDLWKYYVQVALSYSNNALHIKYEDLLAEPRKNLEKILTFVGCKYDKEILTKAEAKFNADRRFAFNDSKELRLFYETVRSDPLVKKLRYDDIF
jgi:hypothetical protein